MRAQDWNGSAAAAFEVRQSIAKFSQLVIAAELQDRKDWSYLLDSAAAVHDSLEQAAAIGRIDSYQREATLASVARVNSELNKLAAIASDKAGSVHAYS